MLSARRCTAIILAFFSAWLFVSPAIAAPGGESRHWYALWPWYKTTASVRNNLQITNLNGHSTKVSVRAFSFDGAYLEGFAIALVVEAGQSVAPHFGSSPEGAPRGTRIPAYMIVVASDPIIVAATVESVVEPLLNATTCREVRSVGSPNGATSVCPGTVYDYDSNGKVMRQTIVPWQYAVRNVWPVYPIDCSGAAPTHLACKQRFGGTVIGPGSAANPGGVGGIGSADDRAPPTEQPGEVGGAETIGPGMEKNIDRPGADFRTFELQSRVPEVCQQQCAQDSRCKAWTYVRPGAGGSKPMCRLKSAVPEKISNNCCISGLTSSTSGGGTGQPGMGATPGGEPTETIAQGMENNSDRPGSDLSAFQMSSRRPELCEQACKARNACRAWTYVRPGVQGPNPVCYLKSQVPPRADNTCCISGVRTN